MLPVTDAPPPSPHAVLAAGSASIRFFLGDCVNVLRSFAPAPFPWSSRPRPTTSAIATAATTTRCRATLSGVDGRLDRGGRAGARAGRLAVPERRRQADRSLDRAGRRAGGARRTCSSRTPSTGSSRSRSTRTPPARRRRSTSDLAVGHYKPINSAALPQRLPRVHLPLHAAGAHRRSTAGRIGVPYQDASRIRPLARPAAATCAAAATPGSSPTRRSRAATRIGRTRRRSRRGCPSTACGCTAWRASSW